MLGDAFLHLIPHALEAEQGGHNRHHDHDHDHDHHGHDHHSHSHDHSAQNRVGLLVLLGMLSFFLLERLARVWGVGHDHSHHQHSHHDGHQLLQQQSAQSTKPEFKRTKAQSRPVIADDSSSRDQQQERYHLQEAHKRSLAGFLNIVADVAHNFTDGLAIAGSFAVGGPAVGLGTSLAVLLHEGQFTLGL